MKQGFAEDMFVRKKCVFREKLRCDSLDIQVCNLVHKQDLCTIQKNDKGIPCIDSVRISFVDISMMVTQYLSS